MTMIRAPAATSEPNEWMELQQGVLLNSRLVEQRLTDTSEALNEV
jgi:hypothetical protein